MKRLEAISIRLKDDNLFTVGAIADEFGVSSRTISRDIEILRDQGLPIDADRGRGGGVRLDRQWGVGRINLTYGEAVDLLISLAIAEQMNSPMFMAQLKPVLAKVMASFSHPLKFKIKNLKSRILIGESASVFTLAAFTNPKKEIVEALHQAFMHMHRIGVSYRAENGNLSQREIEPQYLLLTYPVWYVLAWDYLRNDVRMFRCDRIKHITQLDIGFELLPVTRFKRILAGVHVI